MMTDRYGLPAGDELGTTLHKIESLHSGIVREMAGDANWETKPEETLIDWSNRLGAFVIKATPFRVHLKDSIEQAYLTNQTICTILNRFSHQKLVDATIAHAENMGEP